MRVRSYWYTLLLFFLMFFTAGCGRAGGKEASAMNQEYAEDGVAAGSEFTAEDGTISKDVFTAKDGELLEDIFSSDDTNGSEDMKSNEDINSGETAGGQTDSQIVPENGIIFSQTGYFYSESILLEILSSKPGDIYYTLDGTEPVTESNFYKGHIKLSANEELKVYSIKAKEFFDDGTISDTIAHTYFLGKNVDSRFDTLVFSVTTDPYNLYDYEYGIFVEGKLRDDYIKENPGAVIKPPDPANYNMRGMESEREVFLEIVNPDGTKIADQEAGIRTFGGWSRANKQKSIKIYARKDYDEENNKLRYEFFPWKTAANGDGTILDTFKQLVLRNSGNDNGSTYIRDELFQTIAGLAGYTDYEAVRPAALFINGTYQGFYWLHEVYNDEYFEDNYGKYDGSFEILEGGELYKNPDEDSENIQAKADYSAMYDTYSKLDLTVEDNYKKLSEQIDVDNYLSYYAFEIYIGNYDWPQNNYKTYRYYAAGGEEYREAPFDGKWRYLLHDTDFGFGVNNDDPLKENISRYLGENGEIQDVSPLFGQLMKRADCRATFIRKIEDLTNGVFSEDDFNKVLDEMDSARNNELTEYLKSDVTKFNTEMEELRYFASQRSKNILTSFKDFFSLGELYKLSVRPAEGSKIKINSYTTDQYFEGNYYPDYETEVSAVIPAGREFDYWLVNGKKVRDNELVITSDKITEGKVEVTLALKEKSENPHIIMTEISAEGSKDYIILYNPYKESVSAVGYCITDDITKPTKYYLPMQKLEAGDSVMILCSDSKETSGSGFFTADFKLKAGETIYLLSQGDVVDEVKIPDLNKNRSYKRDLITMKFVEQAKSE